MTCSSRSVGWGATERARTAVDGEARRTLRGAARPSVLVAAAKATRVVIVIRNAQNVSERGIYVSLSSKECAKQSDGTETRVVNAKLVLVLASVDG